MSDRNTRKQLIGVVANSTGNKSVKVTFDYKIPHPLYGKEIKRKTTVHVHDETNACISGDKVLIMATRPLSKLKRWRIVEVLQKAPRS
ncbi:MAG: 30S ribosomal protein S17 [Opitutales bacterium]|jgi:small subunit ribosomal protein S17